MQANKKSGSDYSCFDAAYVENEFKSNTFRSVACSCGRAAKPRRPCTADAACAVGRLTRATKGVKMGWLVWPGEDGIGKTPCLFHLRKNGSQKMRKEPGLLVNENCGRPKRCYGNRSTVDNWLRSAPTNGFGEMR